MQALFVASLLVGCAETRDRYSDSLETPGISGVQALVDRGDFAWDGRGEPGRVDVETTVWARGATRAAATRRAETVDWGLWFSDGWLEVDARVGHRRAGADFALLGPARVHLDVIAAEGAVDLAWVHGVHVVTADVITGWAVAGEVDLFAAAGGVDVAFHPDPDSHSVIEAHGGDLALRLPPGGDYTLEAWLDPGFGGSVVVPGLHVVERGASHLVAVSGTGEAYVEAIAVGGALLVDPADPAQSPVTPR